MDRRHFTFATIAFIIALFLLALYGNIVAGAKKLENPKDDIAALEQAIILQGLDMTSETPLSDDEETGSEDGAIIYDASFDDAIASMNPEGKGAAAEKVDATVSGGKDGIIAGLREKDARWHLTKYRIAKGDNLWTIAKKFNTDHRLIIRANEIENPAMLAPGAVIMVPNRSGVSYTVKSGDTLKSVSGAHGVTVKAIQDHNRITVLKPSAAVFIPDARRIEKAVAGRDASKVTRTAANPGIFLSWPVRGGITSGFGNRLDPFTRRPQFHCGVDIYVPLDTPVLSSAAGTVMFSGWKDGYGNMVVISHPNGYITVYAHNKQNLVIAGAEVKQGQQVALSGMTGAVTGPHVHFELRKYLIPLNPMRFIR